VLRARDRHRLQVISCDIAGNSKIGLRLKQVVVCGINILQPSFLGLRNHDSMSNSMLVVLHLFASRDTFLDPCKLSTIVVFSSLNFFLPEGFHRHTSAVSCIKIVYICRLQHLVSCRRLACMVDCLVNTQMTFWKHDRSRRLIKHLLLMLTLLRGYLLFRVDVLEFMTVTLE